MLAQIKTCRANQVADIFNKNYIKLRQIELMYGGVYHVCIQVAGTSSCYLDCCHTQATNALGVVFSLKVALNDGDMKLITKRHDAGFQ